MVRVIDASDARLLRIHKQLWLGWEPQTVWEDLRKTSRRRRAREVSARCLSYHITCHIRNDHQALTVLLPHSSPEAFKGGGPATGRRHGLLASGRRRPPR